MNRFDEVERPHLLWWIVVEGGLTVLALQGFSSSFYAFWTARVNTLPGQTYMAWMFLACIAIHAAEAIYCWRLSNRLGTRKASPGWALQTFFLGFPSTWLLIRKARPSTAMGSVRSS